MRSRPGRFSRLAWRSIAIATAVVSAASNTGCGVGEFVHRIGGGINPDSLSLADRCADIMRAAIPFAEIEIKNRTSDWGHDVLTAHIDARRADHADDKNIDSDLSAECQFDGSVLIGFKWTKGGAPPHPAVPR